MSLRSLKFPPFFALLTFLLLWCAAGRAQSLSYSNAIVSLNPAGYWPMHEVQAPVRGDIETNYGTLGPLGNGYYPDWEVGSGAFIRQEPGPLANGTDVGIFFTGPAGGGTATNGLFVSRTSPLAALKAPFTVECWYMATNIGTGQGDIFSQADGSKAVGIRVYYQNSAPSDQISILTYPSGQINFATPTVVSNQWHHLVVTCNAATNVTAWLDGVQGSSASLAGKYSYDPHTPFVVGTGLGNARAWHGLVSEVAVYTNVISDIATHYSDAVNASAGAGQYFYDVTNDNPLIYLLLNSVSYTVPSGSLPVLNNYGQTNGVAVNPGVYTPGTVPGLVAGSSFTNYPVGLAGTNVVFLSGVSSFADAGYASAYSPAGGAPFTVTALFRGNPTDTNRVQSIVGAGTNSWELGLTVAGHLVFNSGTNATSVVATGTGAGDLVATANNNDGIWHLVVATHNLTTNILYVDGVANVTNVAVANNVGNSRDVMIGADPSYTNIPVGLGRQFAGQICEVAFFTNALTSAQVQTLYNLSGVLLKITQQPATAAVNQGTAFTNTVVITGSSPIAYQWFTNGVAISGATNASLIFNPVLTGNAATNYYVIATNAFGSVTSSVASLVVYTGPVITSQLPVPYTNLYTLYAGVSPAYSVTAGGAVPFYYRWYTNGVQDTAVNITNASLTVSNVPVGTLAAYCVISNFVGSTTSMVWTASVLATPAAPFPQQILADGPAGYWRLNEPDDGLGDGNPGAVCHDYINGDDGVYTNVFLGQMSYNATSDPTETSAELSYFQTANCDANSIQGMDFTLPANNNAEFSVSAWVYGTGANGNAGIVAKGYFYGEELDLDCGGPGDAYRFEVRSANGTAYNANSTVLPTDRTWHLLVGVCDEANSLVSIYVDGRVAGTAAIPPLSGITNSATVPLMIGARASSATSGANNQFPGYVDDVAIFKYALSTAQVQNLYLAAGNVPPFLTQAPATNTLTVYAGGTLVIPVTVAGTGPLTYQWYDQNGGTNLISGTVNSNVFDATLTVSNVPVSWNNDTLLLTVQNGVGSTNVSLTLNVISGLAASLEPSNVVVAEGQSYTATVAAAGSVPIYYQWYSGGLGGPIANATNATYTAVAVTGTNTYICVVSNGFNGLTAINLPLTLTGAPYLAFYSTGPGWTGVQSGSFSNTPAAFNNGVLTLTDGIGSESRSWFYNAPQSIGAFQASFTYQATPGNSAVPADGMAFVLQNDSRGASAIGSGGGDVGVGGGSSITPSFELELNLYYNVTGGSGYSVNTNGNIGPNAQLGGVILTNGDPITVTLSYSAGQPLSLVFTDAVASVSFSTNINVGNLANVVGGSTAYVGFTGSDGGDTSVQTVSDFTFISRLSLSAEASGTNIVVTWPANLSQYQLQANSSLTTTNWVNVPAAVSLTNNLNEVTLPRPGGAEFYRLQLQ